ncbi:MAG: hypothetical protein U9O55_04230 [Patescibacteria group bacterium]|nr:hypothetical protein [Patescibacteria group bacterium]
MQNQNKNKILDEEIKLNEELEEELEIKEENDFNKSELKIEQDESTDKNKEDDLSDRTKEDSNKGKNDDINEKIEYVKIQLLKIESQAKQALKYLESVHGLPGKTEFSQYEEKKADLAETKETEGQKIIEGVFNGEEMVGADGKRYSISSNYASKSKLVEGDVLKLIIDSDGTFVYKQIGPIERKRVFCALIQNKENNQYYAMEDGDRWKILKASVTYFKGEVGDEIIILIPKEHKSQWAAVENIVKKA